VAAKEGKNLFNSRFCNRDILLQGGIYHIAPMGLKLFSLFVFYK
jgi:hypothetical protein